LQVHNRARNRRWTVEEKSSGGRKIFRWRKNLPVEEKSSGGGKIFIDR